MSNSSRYRLFEGDLEKNRLAWSRWLKAEVVLPVRSFDEDKKKEEDARRYREASGR